MLLLLTFILLEYCLAGRPTRLQNMALLHISTYFSSAAPGYGRLNLQCRCIPKLLRTNALPHAAASRICCCC